ncbi:flagella assembly protein FlgT [Agaribacter flavus]|uniref:Flagellar assembly protein T N-terminal domain-containing protein n=1 Tax=Agaribacter flavus TaxID=1902781 RepID=A0ABV7FNJ3_9ALTE
MTNKQSKCSWAISVRIVGFYLFCIIAGTPYTYAAWFSATGQAVVVDGNKEQAKQQATQEAVKQALLFAGASVRSVQQISNGLLTNDHIEIRSGGEVNSVELIDEIYQDGVVSVSIRADIFAQKNQCSAADYTKRLATTYFPIRYEAQASIGGINKLGGELALQMQDMINTYTPSMHLSHIEPYVFDWHQADIAHHAKFLANKTNTQYVLIVTLDDISVDTSKPSAFEFYRQAKHARAFNFTLSLINGATGENLYTQQYNSRSPWMFDTHETVDVSSQDFWLSQYGQNIKEQLQSSIADLEEFALCQPTMGRVLAVANNQLQINLGRTHQVQAGDQLTLFNVKQISDPFGQEYRQFVLHPTTLVVRQVFSNTATVSAIDNGLLGNVQPNDYVARQ